MYYLNEKMNKNDENNQSIHKTCYDLGSMFEKSGFIHKIIWGSIVLEKSKERTILNVLKQIKINYLQKFHIYHKINIFVIFL